MIAASSAPGRRAPRRPVRQKRGAGEVVVAEDSPGRADVARALGFTVLGDGVDAWLGCKERWFHGPRDHGADVVFQCRARSRALGIALKALRTQGAVVDLAF